MIWDCLIAWVVIILTMVGWANGLLKSWTVPVSMAIGTILTQHIYVDLGTLLVDYLGLEASFAAFAAYFFCWLGIVQYSDMLISRIIRASEKEPSIPFKIGGALLGALKGVSAFVLSAMVAYAHNKIPDPPQVSWQSHWMIRAASDSILLPRLHLIAEKLDTRLGNYVLSTSAPLIPGNLAVNQDPFDSDKKQEERNGQRMGKALKAWEKELDQIE